MESVSLWTKIKRHGSSVAFILGFIWDNFMLSRVDHALANIILGSYLGISAISILIVNIPSTVRWHQKILEKTSKWLPIIVQFCFGSLFSAYIIFYTRSASLANDWLFILILISLVVSNELLRKKYLSMTLPTSMLFTVLFSYTIFLVPVIIKRMDDWTFILSGLISLLIIVLYTKILRRINPEKFAESKKSLSLSLLAIYCAFNLTYFTNLIPPIPLALKDIGIYHDVIKNKNNTYTLKYEPDVWYPFFNNPSKTFHTSLGDTVYVWSTIFAPTQLTVPIFHHWQYFDKGKDEWIETDVLEFSIVGGREEGYRSYTKKSFLQNGLWRVDVETERGNLIGRIKFNVDNSSPRRRLENLIK